MIPKKYDAHDYDYPDFQPDQVLSADHLNHSFAFNEQQERLTRTNMIGIGIVCGLKATRSADWKTVSISKGTGVTSQGYLIVVGEENSEAASEYKQYRSFAPEIVKEVKYDVFVSGGAAKYPVYELLDVNEAKPADLFLNEAFLSNKVCILFYEMLSEEAKNCDTTSCDDKGKTIAVTVRKLLVNFTDADKIILELNTKAQMSGSGEVFPGIFTLPEIKLPRFDVTATGLETTSDLFKAYQKVFTKAFVESVGNALNAAYAIFKTYLKDNSNPFANFNTSFAALHNGTIDGNDLLHIQYYWDFFCDLIAAYNEWRLAAQPLGAICTPPEGLFPRHLLVGYFGETEGVVRSKYRNYFKPSPVLADQDESYKKFKSLFQRLLRMIASRSFPVPAIIGTANADTNIRITPSLHGNYLVGHRSIPYYYKHSEAAGKLVDVWNYADTQCGRQNQILSYKPTYNSVDDFVQNALRYDLEPYNFFRIEGHIGKSYTAVLINLKKLIADNRLPIDIVALELSNDPSNTKIDDACSMSNIQLQYELLKNELKCCLKKTITFWGQLVVKKEPPKAASETDFPALFLVEGIIAYVPEKDVSSNMSINTNSISETLKEVERQFRAAKPEVAAEVRKMVKSIGDAASSVSSDPQKVYLLKESVKIYTEDSIASKYVEFQKNGNISISKTPVPAAVFNSDVLSYYALVIIDEMEEILLLLQAENALTFELTKFAEHIEALKKAYEKLGSLLSAYLKTQKAVYTIKAIIGAAHDRNVDSIAATMPDILEKNSSKIVLLLLNVQEVFTINKLIRDLQKAPTNDEKQKVIDAAYNQLDKDGMMVPAKKEINYVEDSVLKDINARLKNPDCLCSYESFKTLQDLLKKEIDALKQHNLFSKFVKKHPGIQHKAGVTSGGTFIIAYHRKGTESVPQFSNYLKSLNDNVVVADFFLPYLCNSDCQPITFNVTVPVPPVSLALPKLEYCIEDSTLSYLFSANPTGGKLTTVAAQKDSLKDNEDGTFSFLPGKVVIPAGTKDVTISYTYTLGDQIQTIYVKVFAFPKVKIIATPDANNPLKIEFAFDSPDLVSSAAWVFGDGASGAGLTVSRIYSKGGEYSVSSTVTNGVCRFIAENVIVHPKDPEPVEIGLKITEICRDAEVLNFSVKPQGGSFIGEGFEEIEEKKGKFTFSPSKVLSTGEPSKKVDFTYTPPVGDSKTVSITVHEKPQATTGFKLIEVGGNAAQFLFRNLKNASTLVIDYGDGSPEMNYDVKGATSYTSLPHLFPGAGPFVVTAKLINGTCSLDMGELQVRFREVAEVPKTCQSLSLTANAFRRLAPSLSRSPEFIELYGKVRFKELTTFFESLAKQLEHDPTVPLSFFVQNPLNPEWVTALPLNNEKIRALALALLAVLSDLATTISCLKSEDVNSGNVIMLAFLEAVLNKLHELQSLTDEDKNVVKTLVDDVNDELKRLKNNREDEIKVVFSELLRKILEVIKSIS